jgi:hypothetical protein
MPNNPRSETKSNASAPKTGAIDPINGTFSPPKTGHFIYKPYKAMKDRRLMIDPTDAHDTHDTQGKHDKSGERFARDTRTREHTIPSEQFCPTTGEPYPFGTGAGN